MYGKLFVSMYDGTLATRGPWESLVTFQQLLILCDRTGIVDMTPDAISRRTTIPIEIIQKGIETLQEPDPESRSPDDEGRRIARLSDTREWGWQIVNYGKYQSIRSQDERREYMRQYQRKRRAELEPKKPKANGVSDPNASFDLFWPQYPRHEDKSEALKAWRKLAPNAELQATIMTALVNQKASSKWREDNGQFIPYACKWLNKRRWEDEAAPPKQEIFPT